MHFCVIFILMLCRLSRAVPVPVDTIIVQIQWGVVGNQRLVEQVLLNGAALSSTSQEVSSIIQTMSADTVLPALISVNHTSPLRNHTILHSRECILEGSQLHWADRVFYDGEVYLTLDHDEVWTAHVPQALTLKGLLTDQEAQRKQAERIRLQEGCMKLMRELRLSEEPSSISSVAEIPLPQLVIPILALLTFTGLILVSLLLSKNHGMRHPGGVIGSIIHYPKDMSEVPPETKGCGYRTL
ncbi:uncharacterized protein LOC114449966 [Parambassis ranga]|uniref:Uncharacterized protein LOC114449966 n=1 Tax=Parambassis ranga TaxID=210632 RepID=A0A6P7K4K6_9TELE|nr:uncharacterized protein LOC114449966 [Parambassis ranga]